MEEKPGWKNNLLKMKEEPDEIKQREASSLLVSENLSEKMIVYEG